MRTVVRAWVVSGALVAATLFGCGAPTAQAQSYRGYGNGQAQSYRGYGNGRGYGYYRPRYGYDYGGIRSPSWYSGRGEGFLYSWNGGYYRSPLPVVPRPGFMP